MKPLQRMNMNPQQSQTKGDTTQTNYTEVSHKGFTLSLYEY